MEPRINPDFIADVICAEEHAEMLERLRARDEEYAKVAPVVKVEIRGGVRIETRGAAVIGARAVGFVKHY